MHLMPMHANFDQFSEIIKHKKIQQKYYIQNIDAICIIAQDWTIKCIDPKNIVIFYTRLNYKTKLTNSIHFMVFCTDFESTTIIIKVPKFRFSKMKGRSSIFSTNWTRYYAQWYPEYHIRLDNQIRRENFAILHYALKHYFAKNKKMTTNKAGQVLSNQRLIRCISQYV